MAFTVYGEQFGVRKDDKKDWQVYHIKTGARLNSHHLKSEAVSKAKEILSEKGEQETLNSIKLIMTRRIKNRFFNRECIKKLFFNTFGKELRLFRDYMMFVISGEYCLDLIRFDKAIGTPDGVSCKDYIANKYGVRASKLIEKLI